MAKLRTLLEYRNKTELNPKIFEGDTIKKKLRVVLLKIANQFYKELKINVPIEDVVLTGSSANYNWTPTSDIDIHIVLDFKKIKDVEMARSYFDAAKDIFSDKYDLNYNSNPIEVYVEDKNDERPHITGIYSIKSNDWVKKPTYSKVEIADSDIKKKADPIAKSIDAIDFKKPGSIEKLEKIRTKIKNLRQTGLDKAGEYSIENLAFKELRNNGSLQKLTDKRVEAQKIKMAADTLKELVTPANIQTLDTELDDKYRSIPLDIHFSKHFAKQVNLLRNKKPITPQELTALFTKIYGKYGTEFKDLSMDAQGILRDLSTNINVPFYIDKNPKSNKLNLIPTKRLVAATVMRNPDFISNNSKDVIYPVNESLPKNKK